MRAPTIQLKKHRFLASVESWLKLVSVDMADAQATAERVEVLLDEARGVATCLYLDYEQLQDASRRPEALTRSDISGIRKFVQKHCTESLDTEALEKVRW